MYNTMVGPHGQELRVATSHTKGVVRDCGMNEFGLPAHMTSTIQGVKQQLILKEMDERREIVNQMIENNLEAERRKKNPKIAVDLGEANDVASVALLDYMVKRGSVVLNQGGGQSGYEKEQAALQDKFRKQRLAKTMKKAQKKVMTINRFKNAGIMNRLGGAGLDKGSVFGKGAMDDLAAKAEEERKKKQPTGRKAKQLPPKPVYPSKELKTLEAKNEVRKLEDFEQHRLLLARIQHEDDKVKARLDAKEATKKRDLEIKHARLEEFKLRQAANDPMIKWRRRAQKIADNTKATLLFAATARDVVRKIAAIEDDDEAEASAGEFDAAWKRTLAGRYARNRRRYRKARTKGAAVAKIAMGPAERAAAEARMRARASWDELLERHGSGDEGDVDECREGESEAKRRWRKMKVATKGGFGGTGRPSLDGILAAAGAAGADGEGASAAPTDDEASASGLTLGSVEDDGSLASRTVGSLEVEDDDGSLASHASELEGAGSAIAPLPPISGASSAKPSTLRSIGTFKGHIKGSFRFGRGGRAKSPAVAVRTGGDTTTLDATAEEPEHAADDDEPDAPADKPTPERAPRRSRAAAMFGKRNPDG